MELESGRYHVEVSASGHAAWREWVSLGTGEDKRLTVRLNPVSPPPRAEEAKTSTPGSDVIERDGIYVGYANGVVRDTSTGLEWKAGPDRDTDWVDARTWVWSLGEDWRMPTMDELEHLYKGGKGDRNMTPLLKMTGWSVWSGQEEGSSYARGFNFDNGSWNWAGRYDSYDIRAFAVRSRSDGKGQENSVPVQPTPVSAPPRAEKAKTSTAGSDVLKRDGIYVTDAVGIVKDTKTGLEWKAGPDKDTTWDAARSWVESLGGDWRMPTMDELRRLYKKEEGDRNMTPLLKTTGWWVWSGQEQGYEGARGFSFSYGSRVWGDRNDSSNGRAFAVRSRSDG